MIAGGGGVCTGLWGGLLGDGGRVGGPVWVRRSAWGLRLRRASGAVQLGWWFAPTYSDWGPGLRLLSHSPSFSGLGSPSQARPAQCLGDRSLGASAQTRSGQGLGGGGLGSRALCGPGAFLCCCGPIGHQYPILMEDSLEPLATCEHIPQRTAFRLAQVLANQIGLHRVCGRLGQPIGNDTRSKLAATPDFRSEKVVHLGGPCGRCTRSEGQDDAKMVICSAACAFPDVTYHAISIAQLVDIISGHFHPFCPGQQSATRHWQFFTVLHEMETVAR